MAPAFPPPLGGHEGAWRVPELLVGRDLGDARRVAGGGAGLSPLLGEHVGAWRVPEPLVGRNLGDARRVAGSCTGHCP